MKIVTEKAVVAVNVMAGKKLAKMEGAERLAAVRLVCKLKKVQEGYEALLKEAQERLAPENLSAIAAKQQAGAELTAEEKETARGYNAEIAECVRTELAKVVELDCEPLSEEAVMRLAEGNPEMELGEVAALMEAVCASCNE